MAGKKSRKDENDNEYDFEPEVPLALTLTSLRRSRVGLFVGCKGESRTTSNRFAQIRVDDAARRLFDFSDRTGCAFFWQAQESNENQSPGN